jgi:hypothetical protein
MEPVSPIIGTGDGKTPADKIRNRVNGYNVREQFRINSRKQPGTENKKANTGPQRPDCLFISLLMTILSQSFFTLVRRNLMTLPLFTTRHTRIFFIC